MNITLFLSNLRTSVRNLMKYKVQNVISILCLAVGIICFTVTFHLVSGIWTLNYEDSKSHRIDFFESKEHNEVMPVSREMFQKLIDQKPASIEYLLFKELNESEVKWSLVDIDGKEWEMKGDLVAISPDYLSHYGFCSAITGEPIGHLEPGTIIMSDGVWRKTLGEKINPVGWFASAMVDRNCSGAIADVVRSSLRGQLDGMFIVSDTPFLSQSKSEIYDFHVALAEGKNRDDLYPELERLYPDCHPQLWEKNILSSLYKILTLCGLFLFLGSIVLTIGLLGFLKMQLQLFHRRSREMALRRCVGAKPWQLFWLLAIEVFIVFFITLLVALSLTTVLADYALPTLYKMMDNQLYVDMGIIYQRELWISLFTTLLTLAIAALAVRRVIHAPLGLTAGRSNRVSHTNRSIILVLQYVFSIFLFAAVLGTHYFAAYTYDVPQNSSYIKQCMIINRSCNEDSSLQDFTTGELTSLPSLEQAGSILVSSHFATSEIDTTLYVNAANIMNFDNSILGYMYTVASVNEQYFLALGLHPVAEHEGMGNIDMAPVFVRPNDADRIAKTLQAEKGDRRRRVLADGQEYVCIGYVPVWYEAIGRFIHPSYFMIVPQVDENILSRTLSQWNRTQASYNILRPKAHRYDELVEELNNLYHSKRPNNLMPLDIANAYDTWFARARWADMLQQLCWLLSLINLLCIVVSVYSAVSLDTRGREKEVAIRKVHGAKAKDIIRLFGKYYVRLLIISAVIAIPLCIALGVFVFNLMNKEFHRVILSCQWVMTSFIIVCLVTLITVWEKIYRVSKTNPAEIIAKE